MSEAHNPSFSARRRWLIFFSVIVSIIAVLALVATVNYAGAKYFRRFVWAKASETQLSPQTLALIHAVTNDIKIVIYYDKSDGLYELVNNLANEYHLANPRISIQTVDYLVDVSAAQQVKALYKLGNGEDKNLVIFDGNGRHKILPERAMGDYSWHEDPDKEQHYAKRLEAFEGERYFSAALLSIIKPPLAAYYLEGHREHRLEGENSDDYQKFRSVLEENNVHVMPLTLIGTNAIPPECKLLVIAGPRQTIPAEEVEKIGKFLSEGGRLMVLFNYYTRNFATGLEPLLAKWNVKVGLNDIADPDNTRATGGIEISAFRTNHALVTPMIGSALVMVHPRAISVLQPDKTGPEAPRAEEIAFTGNHALVDAHPVRGYVPVVVSVEKGSVRGILRGSTAILTVGDSSIFMNGSKTSEIGIEAGDNRDFAELSIDWLMDQTELLKGVGPHPVVEYKFNITHARFKSLEWIFLLAMPGGILAFGVLVWFRRRY